MPPHPIFELLSYFIGFRVYLHLRQRFGDPLSTPLRWAVIAAAVAGAALGSKLLYWLENPQLTWYNLHDPAYLIGGKTIVGALVFGLVSVELMKPCIGIRQSTGDLYAIPLALGIAIGRVGCFLTGLTDKTYGTPSRLPWGIDFGDGIRRHPTQLYEIVFLLVLIPILYRILHSRSASPLGPASSFQSGDAFKLFMVGYMVFRLLCDFIKPYPHLALGLGSLQWACILVLFYYAPDVARWLSSTRMAASLSA